MSQWQAADQRAPAERRSATGPARTRLAAAVRAPGRAATGLATPTTGRLGRPAGLAAAAGFGAAVALSAIAASAVAVWTARPAVVDRATAPQGSGRGSG